jgi:ATP-dependent exoDNAse (exonuclease V) beta subunit
MEKTDDDKSWDISREIMETGKLILNENNREEITHFDKKKITDFIVIKNKLTELTKELETACVDLANEALLLLENNGIDTNSFPYGTFPKHLNFLREKDSRANNYRFREFDDIKIKKDSKDKTIIESIIPTLLEILDSIYIKIEKLLFYKAFLKNITPLSLLNTLSNKLTEIQKEQGILSITEFNKLIHDQIQNQPAPFIYERLGEKYKHFFIDEFQDTSEMQWQNLIPLIDNATSSEDLHGERGSLLIVGDPKQSIYRWRGGKAEQFIELSKDINPFNNPEKELFSLKTNWRSYSKIIDFNNEFFGFIANEFAHNDYKDLYKNHTYQEENNKKGGYVNISFLPKSEKADYGEEENPAKVEMYLLATLDRIQKVKANGFSYKDIVILTRKKDNGIAIANYLTQHGIPILSSESLLIGSSSVVQCIINVLYYLKNNNDRESKANFLYYIASTRDQSANGTKINCQQELAIHDFISLGMEQNSETDFEQWLASFDIHFSFKNARKKSLYEATESIISKIIPIEKRNAYVQFFLDIVLEQDIKKQAGISDFLLYWDANSGKLSIPSPEGKEAVRIMTIHTSKGLEFPVVIFPFAEEDYSKGPREKIWLDADEVQVGLPKVLVDKNNNVSGYGESAALIYQQKKQEELLDDINILYVAMTRAEEQLYIISGIVSRNKDGILPSNTASFFIKFLEQKNQYNEGKLEYEFGSAEKLSETVESKDETEIIPQLATTLNMKNIKIAQRESLMWNTKQQKAIEYGNILHEILSFIKTKDDIDLALTKAIENGLIVSSQKEDVLKTIYEIVNHQDLSLFFSNEHKILNEKTIIQKEGNLVIPDRMVLTKQNEIYLLDYKTGTHQTKYQLQLENYQKAIEKMGFNVTKKALVYIGDTLEIVNL